MSDKSALTELANFVGTSSLAAPEARTRRAAMTALQDSLIPRPLSGRVSDLLSTVMALSARTKRLVQPTVEVELDVFSPGNRRAVKLTLGEV